MKEVVRFALESRMLGKQSTRTNEERKHQMLEELHRRGIENRYAAAEQRHARQQLRDSTPGGTARNGSN